MMLELKVAPYVPGRARGVLQRGIRGASGNCICMLSQRDLAAFETRPAGLIVMDGAPFSHAMIRLLVLGIPTVMIPANLANRLEPGAEVVIDGLAGKVTQSSSSVSVAVPAPGPVPPPAGAALSLSDHSEVLLRASICSSDDAGFALRQGAAAIGLVRTEYMLPDNGALPDAAFYDDALSALCEAAHPLAVTLRLPDITQDKPVPWLEPFERINTHLGMQGVRLFDQQPLRDVVYALLDAVNVLAEKHRISLLLPYVTQLDEFQRWRDIIEQRLSKHLAIGAMLESPVAVLSLPHWFDIADFVAIGCNDLMQCLFAADRDLAQMRCYLDAYSPQLHRFLQQAAAAAGDDINRVQLCGLLPQLPGIMPVLLGMGFRVFAVAPVMIPYLAKTLDEIDLAQMQALARQVCDAKDSKAVNGLLSDLL